MKIRVTCVFLFLLAMVWGQARLPLAPPYPAPDARYKADILVVVAHPDDETMVAGYLARAIDQGKRVAVVFCTRGQSGGNMVGAEQGLALAMERTMEARRAMATLGIHNVWFLTGRDTPGNGDPLHSLESWGHGQVLEEVVRAIRLTRPEVVITWLPDYVVGENHNDHQASTIITTEAFDLAGDRTAFPEQLEPAENRFGFANLDEGLHPWQAQKLYYFSDATHTGFFEGLGPAVCQPRHLAQAACQLRHAGVALGGAIPDAGRRGARRRGGAAAAYALRPTAGCGAVEPAGAGQVVGRTYLPRALCFGLHRARICRHPRRPRRISSRAWLPADGPARAFAAPGRSVGVLSSFLARARHHATFPAFTAGAGRIARPDFPYRINSA